MRIMGIITFFSLAIMTCPISAQSEICKEEYFQHKQGERLSYQKRTPYRCEGLFWDKKVAGQFEVVSFLFGTLVFDWREDVVLENKGSEPFYDVRTVSF